MSTEWSKGTYAVVTHYNGSYGVGIKYDEFPKQGTICVIKSEVLNDENVKDSIVIDDTNFWCYKKYFKWFKNKRVAELNPPPKKIDTNLS